MMLKEMEHGLTVTGSGESKEKAFHNIFSQLKPMIAKDFSDNIVIRIEPKDVEIEAAIEKMYTERFFGLLFPRQRKYFSITARITMHLHLIELAKVPFEQKTEKVSFAQRVLHRR